MGRIKTQMIKRLTLQLIKEYGRDTFRPDFNENKKLVADRLSTESSKKIRNSIAGYVTRLVKKGVE
ncbi:30S ribosomal protein S17e [Candidatus Woesearchaeota archaeon]|nr:30S ribosomal protein S17e [Candidatus Woesearchaeota archaeon]